MVIPAGRSRHINEKEDTRKSMTYSHIYGREDAHASDLLTHMCRGSFWDCGLQQVFISAGKVLVAHISVG